MSSISIRVDSKDKNMFEDFCNSMGMNVSTAVNMFIKNVITHQKLPFAIERDSFYSKENIKHLEKKAREAKKGINMHYHDIIEN